MTREQKRQIEKLENKIAEAIRHKNFIKQIELVKEKEKILSVERTKQRTTLNDIMSKYSSEDRIEMTTQVIMAVVISDILLSATMDVESKMKKFGISGLPMMKELRDICKRLSSVIRTIDSVDSNIFSENYTDVADYVEEQTLSLVKNLVSDELHKNLKTLKIKK